MTILCRDFSREFIAAVRRINAPRYFVLMTGFDARCKSAELGLEYYLQKPFDPDAALDLVRKLYPACMAV